MPRCPEVFWDEAAARYFCRLATQEEYRFSLAVGEGCCARFNSWRNDVRNRDQD